MLCGSGGLGVLCLLLLVCNGRSLRGKLEGVWLLCILLLVRKRRSLRGGLEVVGFLGSLLMVDFGGAGLEPENSGLTMWIDDA